MSRSFLSKVILNRAIRKDGLNGNLLVTEGKFEEWSPADETRHTERTSSVFAEDNIKQMLNDHLHVNGWET